eukprot:TRINITY_DN1327_c0_g1_i2.p2 TRINITY_DN1327_c0_g1~~TRINITY_DN1327_c0_g1_i2.p2  ORF type:complete len:132 (+),score=39.10 TRINITY_DN1327_c0_g1_i2:49-444(+)
MGEDDGLAALEASLLNTVRAVQDLQYVAQRPHDPESAAGYTQCLDGVVAQFADVRARALAVDPELNGLPCPIHAVESADIGRDFSESSAALELVVSEMKRSAVPKHEVISAYADALDAKLQAIENRESNEA